MRRVTAAVLAAVIGVPSVACAPTGPDGTITTPTTTKIPTTTTTPTSTTTTKAPTTTTIAPPPPSTTTTVPAVGPFSMAVIGDAPYGPDQTSPTAMPRLVSSINGAPGVSLAVHLGDIKDGASECSNQYFAGIKAQFDTFVDPLVFTPGDNEWADCHKPSAGGYLPTERLDTLRSTFFVTPGATLGRTRRAVTSQASSPGYAAYRENVRWEDAGVVLTTVNLPGSNNGSLPWFSAAGQISTPALVAAQSAEVQQRSAAANRWLNETFDRATSIGAPAVVLFTQADMFSSTSGAAGVSGYASVVSTLASRAAAFNRPVLLMTGDSHAFRVTKPLATPNTLYPGLTTVAPLLTQVVVEGEQTTEWLEITIDPRAVQPFSWIRRTA